MLELGTSKDQAADRGLAAALRHRAVILVEDCGGGPRARERLAIGQARSATAPQLHQVRPARADDVSRQDRRGRQREQQILVGGTGRELRAVRPEEAQEMTAD